MPGDGLEVDTMEASRQSRGASRHRSSFTWPKRVNILCLTCLTDYSDIYLFLSMLYSEPCCQSPSEIQIAGND